MKYRTKEQAFDIIENCINGNWDDATKTYKKCMFNVKDFHDRLTELREEATIGYEFEDIDVAYLVERSKEI